jgi:hypothetical protein
MAALAEESAAALPTSEEQEAVERLDLELDNLRAVHRWAVQTGEPDLVLRLVASLFRYGYWRLRREVLQWAEAAATDASAPAHPARPRACAAAVRAQQGGDAQTLVLNLAGQALARAYGGDTTTGAQLSTAAREHAERSDNPTAHAWAAYAWAEVLGADEPDRALAPVEQARATAASVGNEFVAGIAESPPPRCAAASATPTTRCRASAISSPAGATAPTGPSSGPPCATSSSCWHASKSMRPPQRSTAPRPPREKGRATTALTPPASEQPCTRHGNVWAPTATPPPSSTVEG